jgi:hypothetical protein
VSGRIGTSRHFIQANPIHSVLCYPVDGDFALCFQPACHSSRFLMALESLSMAGNPVCH